MSKKRNNIKIKAFVGLFAVAALVVSAFPALRTSATFKGPDPVTNGKIVFATDNGHTLKVANADGSGAVNLITDNQATILGDAVWSPDKSKILFVMFKNDQQNLYTVNGADANQTPTQVTSGGSGVDPSWSPEGDYVAYARNVTVGSGSSAVSVSNIFVAKADGTGTPEQLTNYTTAATQAFDPSWSPIAGSKDIVYTTASSIVAVPRVDSKGAGTGDNGDVRIMEVNGGYDDTVTDEELKFAHTNDGGEYDPTFSPDGTRVYFVRSGAKSAIIGYVSSDNNDSGFHPVVPWNVIDKTPDETYVLPQDPTLSPDGKKILFVRSNFLLAAGEVMVYDVQTNTTSKLSSAGSEPDWTYAAEGEEPPAGSTLEDISVTCKTEVGTNCEIEVPEWCQNEIDTAPLYGTSLVVLGNNESGTAPGSTPGTLVYKPNFAPFEDWNTKEENYVHVRNNGISVAKCNIKIQFTKDGDIIDPEDPPIKVPETGIVGGLIGMALAGSAAGGVLYAKERKLRLHKKASSEK